LAYAAEGKYDEAIAAYDEALRLTPEFWAARFNRGIAYHLKGDFGGAIEAFTQFIGRKQQYAPAYHQRGLAHLARNEFDAAIADFTQAFQLDPNLTEAYASCIEATRLKFDTERKKNDGFLGRLGETKKTEIARTTLAIPPESNDEESAKETRSPAATDGTEQTPAKAPKLSVPSSKLQLECPECGTLGLLDMRHLGKKFRCPGCQFWWRTNASGNLEETTKPEHTPDAGPRSGVCRPSPDSAADMGPKSGIWKPATSKPVGSLAENTASALSEAMLSGTTAATSSAPASPSHPAVKLMPVKSAGKAPRRRKESSLQYAGLWIATVSRTKPGRVLAILIVLLALFSIPFLFPSLFASELRSRAQKVAAAWLARDVEQLRPFVDPTLVESIPRWLETTPPPELTEDQGRADMMVSVERNDGDTAEVLIQIKAAKHNGTSAYYVFRHRWVLRKDTWYVQPDLPPAGVNGSGAVGKGGKSR
jgi:predicted RNA-binding Zn-ribbon protein involved in translation (DUF1610 family)